MSVSRKAAVFLVLSSLLGLIGTSALACPGSPPNIDPCIRSAAGEPSKEVGQLERSSAAATSLLREERSPRMDIVPNAATAGKIGAFYLEYMEKNGGMADFRKPEVIKGFEAQLPLVPLSSEKPSGEGSDYRNQLCYYYENILQQELSKTLFPDVNPSELTLLLPSVAPGSGAHVYLVKNKSTGKILAAFKIQGKTAGISEVTQTSAAEVLLKDRVGDGVHFVKTLSIGQLGDGDYFIIQSGAPGKDLDSILKKAFQETNSMRQIRSATNNVIVTSAQIFANIHAKMNRPNPKTPSKSDGEERIEDREYFDEGRINAKFKKYAQYEIDSVANKILGTDAKSPGIVAFALKQGTISTTVSDELRNKIQKLTNKYQALVNDHPQLLAPSVVYGDAHGGNIFIDKDGDPTLIDYASLMWSVLDRQNKGFGDPATDIGRMVGYFQTEYLKNGASINVALKAGEKFVKAYIAEYKKAVSVDKLSSDRIKALQTAIDFYRVRYLAVQANDRSYLKFRSQTESLRNPDLLKRLFKLLSKSLDVYK